MKLLIIIISALTLGLHSCANKEMQEQGTHVISTQLSPLFQMKDSLSIIFYDKEFKANLDTFRFEGTEQPETISIIEYYGSSGYTVSNIKCMLSGYSKVGLITLFKYNSSLKGWEKVKSVTVSVPKLIEIKSEVENSPYWNGKNSSNDTQSYMLGDLVRYTTFGTQNEDMIVKRVEDPNAKLYDMLVKITHE